MPQSAIATGLVDWILPLADIPDAIIRYDRTEPKVSAPKHDADERVEPLDADEQSYLHKILAQLRARTDRDFSRYKQSTILRRISRRMQINYIDDLPAYLEKLRSDSEEVKALADDCLITVTNFFRDPGVFERLEKEVIPRLFKQKGPKDTIRVWSVGCATGEEAYSLAMLLAEESARQASPPRIQIFASDLHRRSLDRGREALYSGDIEADVSPERLTRFLEYGLPFERFLNPDRVTMPDIDIDFQDSRRDEVIEYVTRKYGDDRVAQIITFGTLGAKAAIRDVGRAMGLTYAEADRVAKAVPLELNISLDRAVETSPQLRELMAGDDRVDKLIGIAKQLEGVSRHASTHAAGIVISREPLTEIMPLQRATDGKTTMTQFEMHACEALGLLKFDFLGLINLTILADAIDLVEKHRGVRLDVDTLPLDDKKTFELLGHGDTMGVFQLEGSGMRRYVRELKPTEVRDLAAMVALFRPGPMANIPAYIRRKHGEEPVTYLHESLEPALRDTYGIFVYQEDIMTAAIAMADYTGPEADNLCYAIRKKKEDVLRQHEAKFKAGAKKKGIPPHIVDKVFAEFEPFARYGFNKAHATCYGLIAYQTAYLKANYPIEFMTAVMNGFRERAEKVAAVIAECRRLGIEVRPPDVQKSHALFTVETDASGAPEAIRFGLAAIKNVGEGAVDAIVAVRDGGAEPGPFVSLDDFCRRVDLHVLNRRVLESLIKANAMASLGTGSALLEALDASLENGARHQRDVAAGQSTLFDLFAMPAEGSGSSFLDGGDEIPKRERLRWEKELIGLYLSDHPLSEIENELPDYATALVVDLAEEADQTKVTLGGIVASSRRVITRAGSTMLVATLEDLTGSVEVVVFPKVYEQTAPAWSDDSIVLVSGRLDRRDEAPQILCEAVWSWEDATRMGVAAFGAERDRALAPRGRWERNGKPRVRRSRWRRLHPSRWPSPRPSARRSPPRSRPPRPMRSRSSRRPRGRLGPWPC